MKQLYFLFFLLILSCNSNTIKNSVDSNLNNSIKLIDSNSQTDINVQKSKDKSILGVWQLVDEENPVFEIKKDSIFYIDQFTNYKYSTNENSITIFYTDNVYKGVFTLINDTLWIKNDDQEDKYLRVKD